MGLFDKLFGKKVETNKPITTQPSNEESYDIKNFKLYNLEENEIIAIDEFSNYISKILPLYVSNLNTSHILHPENLINFSQIWFNPENQDRNIADPTMIEYLGVSLGKYINETTNFKWCNAADLRTEHNGNINSECALIDKNSNTLFIPIKVFSKEVFEKKGYIQEQLYRIKNLENFGIKSTEKNQDETINSDIDKLIANATKSGNSEDLTILWRTTLNLKQWHFITKHRDDINDRNPFIGEIENRPWVFLFTDRQKAQQYCTTDGNDGFTDENGGVYIISMDTDKAIDYIFKLYEQGVFGMRINEGNGWFSPIENLKAIIDFVKI